MRIGGLQKLTLLDYPGKVACTVFLSGCNLRCPYCHNPGLVLPEQSEGSEIPEAEVLSFLERRKGKLRLLTALYAVIPALCFGNILFPLAECG